MTPKSIGELIAEHADRMQDARNDAAQVEWERWKRANGVAAAGIRATADEIRKIAKRLDIDAKDQRDLERLADGLLENAEQLDGENWLKSPKAMAEIRKENGTHEH